MVEGKKINMGGQEWIVPALSLGQIKRHLDDMERLAKGDADSYDAAVSVVTSALSRNYPNINENQVVEMLDMKNLPIVIKAIMGKDDDGEKSEKKD